MESLSQSLHITHLVQAMRVQLLPMRYDAQADDSLQIRRIGDDLRRPRADILVSDRDTQREARPTTPHIAVQPLALAELIDDEQDIEHPYQAIRAR